MAIRKRNETVDLKVSRNENIMLTVTIGNAQIGASVMRLKGSSEVIAKGEIENLDLGMGSDLVGKTLKITTNILDMNDQTNGIVVTYYFHNCTPPVVVFDDTVDNDGDIFSFLIEVNFK